MTNIREGRLGWQDVLDAALGHLVDNDDDDVLEDGVISLS